MIITSGIGICTDDIKNMSIDGIKNLIAMMPDDVDAKALLNQDLIDAHDEGLDKADELAEYLGQCWQDYEEVGIATVLAIVIDKCEHIKMLPTMDDKGYTFLIFNERAPWKYNTREKSLTESELIAILGKYIRILTTEDVLVKKLKVETYVHNY